MKRIAVLCLALAVALPVLAAPPKRTPAKPAPRGTTAAPQAQRGGSAAANTPTSQTAGAAAQQQQQAPRQVGPNFDSPDQVKAEIERFNDAYRAIVSYHVLLQGDANKETVDAALFDVRQYVDELESRYATDQLFIKDKDALEEMKMVVAKAHLQDALLNARGTDLERSITEYEKAVELLGYDPSDWDTTVERTARLGLSPHATEIAYEIATPREVVEDLKVFWSSGVMARIRIQGYGGAQRAGLKLERIGGANDGFSQTAFKTAAERFAERAAAGVDEIRIALPAGHYRISGKDQSVRQVQFVLAQNSAPDPIVLNPNTFNFEFAAASETCRPTLISNGLPVRDLKNLPFGTYRVDAPKTCTERLPDKITVEQRGDVTVRTEPDRLDYLREGQPIFVFVTTPPGSTYKLRM